MLVVTPTRMHCIGSLNPNNHFQMYTSLVVLGNVEYAADNVRYGVKREANCFCLKSFSMQCLLLLKVKCSAFSFAILAARKPYALGSIRFDPIRFKIWFKIWFGIHRYRSICQRSVSSSPFFSFSPLETVLFFNISDTHIMMICSLNKCMRSLRSRTNDSAPSNHAHTHTRVYVYLCCESTHFIVRRKQKTSTHSHTGKRREAVERARAR